MNAIERFIGEFSEFVIGGGELGFTGDLPLRRRILILTEHGEFFNVSDGAIERAKSSDGENLTIIHSPNRESFALNSSEIDYLEEF